MADEHARIGRAIAPLGVPFAHAWPFDGLAGWMPLMLERGGWGPGSFCGAIVTGDVNYKSFTEFCLEHDLYASACISDKILLNGPISAIEEEVRVRCELAKSRTGSRCAAGIATPDYFTPPAHMDAAIEAAKKFGRF